MAAGDYAPPPFTAPEALHEFARTAGIPQQHAAGLVAAVEKREHALVEQARAIWRQDLEADPEYDSLTADAKFGLANTNVPGLRELMSSPLGEAAPMVRLLAAHGQALRRIDELTEGRR